MPVSTRQPAAPGVYLAAFPKGFMDALCVERSLSLERWIEMAATLQIEGLEMYPLFFASFERDYLEQIKAALAAAGLAMPMLCYSPDFTQPDPQARRQEVERQKRMIDLVADFGGQICRVLSGQRRPEVSRADGVRWVVECIRELVEYAAEKRVILAMENHYKDGYWQYPEFAQYSDVFLEIIEQIDSPWFGVNYDPSNALVAGEDPLTLLDKVKHRVVSMHASDRYLKGGGTLEDLRRHEGRLGYADVLVHGVIGEGLNDYDAIFTKLREAGFRGWISIEDGLGMDELRRSVAFLREKIARHFG